MKKETRAMSRRHIFNIIFRYLFADKLSAEEFINDYTDLIDYERESESKSSDYEDLELDIDFINSQVSGIIGNISNIDDVIKKYIVGWTIDRLASVDVTILRIAIYEILYNENIPPSVSANEAVELAKDYGGEKSPSFINGILSNVIKFEKERR